MGDVHQQIVSETLEVDLRVFKKHLQVQKRVEGGISFRVEVGEPNLAQRVFRIALLVNVEHQKQSLVAVKIWRGLLPELRGELLWVGEIGVELSAADDLLPLPVVDRDLFLFVVEACAATARRD